MSIIGLSRLFELAIENKAVSVGCIVLIPVLIALAIAGIRKYRKNNSQAEEAEEEERTPDTIKLKIKEISFKKKILKDIAKIALVAPEIENINIWCKARYSRIKSIKEKYLDIQKKIAENQPILEGQEDTSRILDKYMDEIKVEIFYIGAKIKKILENTNRFIKKHIPILEEKRKEIKQFAKENSLKNINTFEYEFKRLIEKIRKRTNEKESELTDPSGNRKEIKLSEKEIKRLDEERKEILSS